MEAKPLYDNERKCCPSFCLICKCQKKIYDKRTENSGGSMLPFKEEKYVKYSCKPNSAVYSGW